MKNLFVLIAMGVFVLFLYSALCNERSQTSTEASLDSIGHIDSLKTKIPREYVATDTIYLGTFKYKIRATGFNKELGTDYNFKTADGVYLIVKLDFTNISNRPDTLYMQQFRLRDAAYALYNVSVEGSYGLSLDGSKILTMEDCNPGIKKTRWLCFEVPKPGKYYLMIATKDSNTKMVSIQLRS